MAMNKDFQKTLQFAFDIAFNWKLFYQGIDRIVYSCSYLSHCSLHVLST